MNSEELIRIGLVEGSKLLGLISFLFYQIRKYGQRLDKIDSQLSDLKVTSAVLSRDIKHALDLKAVVTADHDALVALGELVKRNVNDLNATHSKLRDLKEA